MSNVDWQKAFEETANDVAEGRVDASTVGLPHLMRRTGGWKATEADWQKLATTAATAAAFEYGPAEKRYGPFRLHRLIIVYNDGRREERPRYQVVLGEYPTPFVYPFDPKEMADRQRELFAFATHGQVPVEQSELADVVRHVKLKLLNWEASLDYYREWQAAHPERAAERAGNIADTEANFRATTEGLRELEAEYGDALSTLNTDLSAEEAEREVHDLRLRLSGMDGMWEFLGVRRSPRDDRTKR